MQYTRTCRNIILYPTELGGVRYAPVCVRAAFAFIASKAQARPRESAQVEWRLCNDTRGNVSIFRDGAAAAAAATESAKHCTFATRRILSCATRARGRTSLLASVMTIPEPRSPILQVGDSTS